VSDGIRLADIDALLQEAARLSNHRNFVIVGSLSVLGTVLRPPERMVLSTDVDLFTKSDPGRVFREIAASLSEGSAWARSNVVHADPVSPAIVSAPEGWETRLIPLPMSNGITGWFMDANDAACAKLVRCSENDIRWVTAGIEEGILSTVIICDRLPLCLNASVDEIRRAEASVKEIGRGLARR
jgi:hypothetical protein